MDVLKEHNVFAYEYSEKDFKNDKKVIASALLNNICFLLQHFQ